jgi:hypothetical protein
MMGRDARKFNVSSERAMSDTLSTDPTTQDAEPATKPLSPAAQRALAEADARRVEALRREAEAPRELGGRNGPDPARYGDWEVKGMASDF